MWNQRKSANIARQLVSWRRMFHAYPEVSREEKQTSELIVSILNNMDIEVKTFKNHYGVCGTIHGKYPGPVVVFRCDMDALSITEATDVSYRSTNSGVMHACGHDGHMAIALGLAEMFSCNNDFAGTVKILFQPAEEAAPVGGADLLIKEGLLDNADVIFGLHLWPDLPCGHIGIRSGPLMAASDRFTIRLLGQGAHVGQPQNGIDSITIAADVIHGFSHIMNRQIDPLEMATLSIGKIQGGERYNVIAREVEMEGTVRTLGEKVRNEIKGKVERVLSGMTAVHGGDYILNYQYGYPILDNCPIPTDIVTHAAKQVIGDNAVHNNIKPVLASEDFGRYLSKVQGAYFWLGCTKDGAKKHGLHSPDFDFDEDALLIGVKILYQTGLNALVHFKKEENNGQKSKAE